MRTISAGRRIIYINATPGTSHAHQQQHALSVRYCARATGELRGSPGRAARGLTVRVRMPRPHCHTATSGCCTHGALTPGSPPTVRLWLRLPNE